MEIRQALLLPLLVNDTKRAFHNINVFHVRLWPEDVDKVMCLVIEGAVVICYEAAALDQWR